VSLCAFRGTKSRLYYGVKDYENAIRAFDYATLIDDEF
jgi:hypothetical protein